MQMPLINSCALSMFEYCSILYFLNASLSLVLEWSTLMLCQIIKSYHQGNLSQSFCLKYRNFEMNLGARATIVGTCPTFNIFNKSPLFRLYSWLCCAVEGAN